MNLLALDFESYFDKDYSLKKMTTESYVRDLRFQALCLGWAKPNGESGWIPQEEITLFLSQIDWGSYGIVAHHAQFDGLILAHHYGVRPALWLDTLSMARLQLGTYRSVALGALAQHYGLPEKTVPYDVFRGREWTNLFPHERRQVSEGSRHDASLTAQIFDKLRKGFPEEEYFVIDRTIRMFTEPVLVGDAQEFGRIAHEENLRKGEILVELGVTESALQSVAKFGALLEAEGVELEYKAGKDGPIAAIAKTDDFMKRLQEDENPRVVALAEARLDVRSTITETRAGRLAGMSGRGSLCIYLNYFGAHTGRWSGGDRINWQNLTGPLASHVVSPQGFLLGKADFAQIECRILNYLARQIDVVEAFREGRDLYAEAASRFYGRVINKQNDPVERFLFKRVELGCGYGMGTDKFRAILRAGGGGGGGGPSIHLSQEEAQSAIDFYRSTHPYVAAYWKEAGRLIAALAGTDRPVQWGPMTIVTGKVILPNGILLHYPELEYSNEKDEKGFNVGWTFRTRKGINKLYSGKFVENVVQALARVVMSQAMIRVVNEIGLKPVLTTHDDVVWLIPSNVTPGECWMHVKNLMQKTPDWLPGIPLKIEGELKETL